MMSDLRFAWRALWKSPTTTLGAMLALALGIGATTTMFGLLNAVALRPLPYPESDRLVELWGNVERQVVERRGTSIPDYLDWRDEEPLVRPDVGVVEREFRHLRQRRAGRRLAAKWSPANTSTCSVSSRIIGRTLDQQDDAAAARSWR